MKCFTHQVDSVGICKSCNKAVCSECAVDTGRGLACSDFCVEELNDINVIMDKSKQIYGIGNDSKLPPTGILMYMFFAAAFIGFGVYQTILKGRPDYFLFVMGTGFLVVGGLAWYRNRKLNINC
ncbi:hypothetical protein KO525_15760 [Psychrosphaera sp. B3R10]|uniref:B box-type domain-containing protein n=1 Tax=Psychrosphaera algicola TaxID=3023714 RepID=A0ABT5FJR0_9GAMM|nr:MULTISPECIES: hypothetical protein [unclassified Psychrosphaera]MBU2880933.1 hypothetical protein [Psychrosphaera sp. I2R16]MBU2990848.1 hypothetical protein [Psychrosphaera sp. B3R10]MDC2891435.1 hypothetical protein [Psychrosphaera sp. G1-22]MDO6720544.1 hypothetical protein [Psychrosphaera sp. 1_MG-2023]